MELLHVAEVSGMEGSEKLLDTGFDPRAALSLVT